MSNQTSWIVGVHAVETALRNDPESVSEVRFSATAKNKRINELKSVAATAGISMQSITADELQRIAGRSAHQGVAAQVATPPLATMDELESAVSAAGQSAMVLLLDGVQDPGNLGACLRTAECVGITGVVLPRHRAAGLSPTVHKTSAGAAARLRIVEVANLVDALKQLKEWGLWVVGADGEADRPLYDIDLAGPLAVVMGNEEKGLRRLVREHCDFLASIPMSGATASLNVSVATGICLFEADRQRRLR